LIVSTRLIVLDFLHTIYWKKEEANNCVLDANLYIMLILIYYIKTLN